MREKLISSLSACFFASTPSRVKSSLSPSLILSLSHAQSSFFLPLYLALFLALSWWNKFFHREERHATPLSWERDACSLSLSLSQFLLKLPLSLSLASPTLAFLVQACGGGACNFSSFFLSLSLSRRKNSVTRKLRRAFALTVSCHCKRKESKKRREMERREERGI